MKHPKRSHELLKTIYYDQLEDYEIPEPTKPKLLQEALKEIHNEVSSK